MAFKKTDSILIGITGGIASGKSTIIRHLNQKGYSTIEADKMGHKILEPKNPGFDEILDEFGKEILDSEGYINRQILGRIVFSNPKNLKKLNDISHPVIAEMIKKEYNNLVLNSLGKIVFLEAAILIETNWYKFCDQVWVVMVEPSIALKRLQLRDRLSKEEAESRLASQISADCRKEHADIILNNDKSSEDLIRQTEVVLKRLNPSKVVVVDQR